MKEIKFDRRASKYDEGLEGRLSERFYHSLVNAIELKKGYSVLDVGCGTGTILSRLSRKTAIYGYGIDVSEAMLKEARQKCPQMSFQAGDCAQLPFEDHSFDVVTACMAYDGCRKKGIHSLAVSFAGGRRTAADRRYCV